MLHSDAVDIFPETSDDLAKIDPHIGDYVEGAYAISLRDDVDMVVVVGTLDQLESVIEQMRGQLVKLRRYDRSLAHAKAKLEGRLKNVDADA